MKKSICGILILVLLLSLVFSFYTKNGLPGTALFSLFRKKSLLLERKRLSSSQRKSSPDA